MKKLSKTHILNRITSIPTRWYLAIIVALAVVIRLISITKASIWHDEGYTMMLIQHDVVDIIARTARDVHPPLYYIVAHFWEMLLGNSELAIRSLSLVFGVATIVVVYFIVRRLFTENTARLASLFMALGPFVVRYSEEARMYSLAALLVCVATLVLLIALDKHHIKKADIRVWLVYGLVVAAALYTHYFTILVVPVHILYALYRYGNITKLIQRREWWIGNALAAGLFLPWLPALINQFTRIQSGFWIPPVNAETIPSTLMQFFVFSSDAVPSSIEMMILLGMAILLTWIVISSKARANILFVIGWAFLPLFIVLLLSFKQPVYYDRYFVYCSIGFYILLAVIITQIDWKKSKIWIRNSIAGLVCLTFVVGIAGVDLQANHKMRETGAFVNQEFRKGDMILSAELYTYFDFSYYNKTGVPVKLLSSEPLSGYGESSLIYDKQDELVVRQLIDIQKSPTVGRVWVIGKTGQHDYFEKDIPRTWHFVELTEKGDTAARLYELSTLTRDDIH